MKYFIFIFLTFFSFSCTKKNHTNEKQTSVNEVRKKTAIKIKKEKNLVPFGYGSRMSDEIKMLILSFNYHDCVDIDKGRELLIYAVDQFIKEINANEPIRKYLYNYPFQPQNVEIKIFIEKNKTNSSTGGLDIITFVDGLLEYKIWHEESKSCTIIHTETYEEALQQLEITSIKASLHDSTFSHER